MIYTVTEESGTKKLEQLAGSSSTGTPLGTWASFETDYAPNIEWLQGGTTFNPNTYPALAMYLGGNTVPERFDHSRPSEWEPITLPTTSATAITMQYDGQLLMTANTNLTIIYKNGSEFFRQTTGGNHTQEMYLTFSKGDVFYVSSALLFCYVRYYKHPLFIKATPTSSDSDYEGTLNGIRTYVSNSIKQLPHYPDYASGSIYTTAVTEYICPEDCYVVAEVVGNGRYLQIDGVNVSALSSTGGLYFGSFSGYVKKGSKIKKNSNTTIELMEMNVFKLLS